MDEVDSSEDRIVNCSDNCQISQISLSQAPYIDFNDAPKGRVPISFPACLFAILLVENTSHHMFITSPPKIDGRLFAYGAHHTFHSD